MGIRSHFAIAVGKTSQWALKTFFKGGSSLPGKLALKVDPHILDSLAKDYQNYFYLQIFSVIKWIGMEKFIRPIK